MRMGMRRFTRLTNAFSKKAENHAAMVAKQQTAERMPSTALGTSRRYENPRGRGDDDRQRDAALKARRYIQTWGIDGRARPREAAKRQKQQQIPHPHPQRAGPGSG
jgi:hypothetical protein